jgi:8-oxo-dGTP diphosphatase
MDKIIKYGLIILKNGKFLINRKYNTKLFLMPGGKPEPNEKIEACLLRELQEEHNLKLIKESITHFGDFEDMAANEPNTIISMKVYLAEVIGEPTPNQEIEEQRWFGREDNKDLLSPIIKNKILPLMLEKGII